MGLMKDICIIVTVAALALLGLSACQFDTAGSAVASPDRQIKLLKAENARLRDQLAKMPDYAADNARLKAENANAKKLTAKLESVTTELAAVKEENATMQKKTDETVAFVMNTVLEEAKKDCNNVRIENQQLKAQLKSATAK